MKALAKELLKGVLGTIEAIAIAVLLLYGLPFLIWVIYLVWHHLKDLDTNTLFPSTGIQ
jgi:hypothetical protein